jgi:hypothetical protein
MCPRETDQPIGHGLATCGQLAADACRRHLGGHQRAHDRQGSGVLGIRGPDERLHQMPAVRVARSSGSPDRNAARSLKKSLIFYTVPVGRSGRHRTQMMPPVSTIAAPEEPWVCAAGLVA